jgi:hypothetical protein
MTFFGILGHRPKNIKKRRGVCGMDNIYLLSRCPEKRGWFPVEINLDGDPKRLHYYVLVDVRHDLPKGRWVREVRYLLVEEPPKMSDTFILDMSFYVVGIWHTANDGQSFWESKPVCLTIDEKEKYLKHFYTDMDEEVANSIFSIIFTQIDKERHPDFYEEMKSS